MKKFFLILVLMLISPFVQAKELTFVQISDIHLSITGEDYRGRKVKEAAVSLSKAVKEINKNKKVKFVLFTGDNIDTAERENFLTFLYIANKLNKPYYVVIGNHEVFRYNRFYKKDFVHTLWLHHPQMLFKGPNYVFKPNKEFVFIVVDGANELIPSPSGYFKPETLAWLDKQLNKYKNKKVVLVQHFPIIPPMKKTSHNTVDADKYFQVINSYDNIVAILSGHFHCNNVIYKKGIYHMSAPAFVMRPHEYKIITIDYDPKYLFSNPPEFDISQELIPMIDIDTEGNTVYHPKFNNMNIKVDETTEKKGN